jgi:hypothetical protein
VRHRLGQERADAPGRHPAPPNSRARSAATRPRTGAQSAKAVGW